jgi:hypothetical protein
LLGYRQRVIDLVPQVSDDTFHFLHAALDRVYKLAVSLPDAPLGRFRAKITSCRGRLRPSGWSSSASARTFSAMP